MRIQVKDFMSSPVKTCVATTSIAELRSLMDRQNIHAIPVVEYTKKLPKSEAKILGIVSISDLGKKLGKKTPASDVMSTMVHVVHKNSSAQAAAKMMLRHGVHHIIVMDDGEIIGILSSLDFVKLVSEHILE